MNARADASAPSDREGPVAPDWSALYDEHFDFVWRSLRRLGVPESSLDDVAQEVFVLAFRRREAFEGRSSHKTWLFGIAWHKARELSRHARRHPEAELTEMDLPPAVANQEDALERREALRFLYRVLGELAPERRAVLVMARWKRCRPQRSPRSWACRSTPSTRVFAWRGVISKSR